MIDLHDVRKVFPARRRSGEVVAVDGVTLRVAAGEFAGVVGPSGSGTSTLVRLVNLLERPTSGSVTVDGRVLTELPDDEVRQARRSIGMVFQHFELLDSRTAAGNVEHPLELAGVGRAERRWPSRSCSSSRPSGVPPAGRPPARRATGSATTARASSRWTRRCACSARGTSTRSCPEPAAEPSGGGPGGPDSAAARRHGVQADDRRGAAAMPEHPMLDRSRFLEGPFAPVTEEVTAFDLPVTGSLPAELHGRYLRNGPNPLGLDEPVQHWFLGPGMVHGVRLRDGRAEWYRNRWVRSRQVAEALGERWAGGPVHAGMDFAANTHVLAHAGRTLATVEGGALPYELTDELDTVGPCDFGGTLPGGYAAHTKLDQRTGDLHAVAYFWGWDHVQHVVIGPDGRVSSTTDVPVADGPMMHDFALTERYVVLLDLPVTFSMDAAAAGSSLPYGWNPAHPARVGLLPREGSAREVRWCEVDPCWVFHTLNAYDDGDRVVVDLCRYGGAYDLTGLSGQGPLTLDRWTVDPVRGRVGQERLDDRPQEFPRTDERVVSRPHRYGYSVVTGEVGRATVGMDGSFEDGAFADALLKHDLVTGRVEAHRFGRGATVGEAVFAPSAPDAAEDEGYVLAFVHDPDRGAADLVVLAAQDFTGGPVARVHLPARVPLGFHGSWIPDR